VVETEEEPEEDDYEHESASGGKKLKMEESAKTRRGPWTTEEDELLTNLVKRFGTKKWAIIAELVPGRVGKQCRERWLNHLNANVKKTAWTDEEDDILVRAQQELGNRWSAIARLLPGRPENSVKNRWNSLINKKKRCVAEDPESGNISSDDQSSDVSCGETFEKSPISAQQENRLQSVQPAVPDGTSGVTKSNSMFFTPPAHLGLLNPSFLMKNELAGGRWSLYPMQQPRFNMSIFSNSNSREMMQRGFLPHVAGKLSTAERPPQTEDSKGAAQGLMLLATLCT